MIVAQIGTDERTATNDVARGTSPSAERIQGDSPVMAGQAKLLRAAGLDGRSAIERRRGINGKVLHGSNFMVP